MACAPGGPWDGEGRRHGLSPWWSVPEFAAVTGQSTEKAKAEGLRSKLKLLAARGWLAAVPGGLFTLDDHAGKTSKPGQ
jgi:hypothetical protein